MQFYANDEGVPVNKRLFPSEIAALSGPASCPDDVIWSMQTETAMWIELTSQPLGGKIDQEAHRTDGQVQ